MRSLHSGAQACRVIPVINSVSGENTMRFVMKLAAFAALASTPALAQHFDDGVYYRLTTQFRGPNMALDVYNGGDKDNMTHLTRSRDLSGQYWALSPVSHGFYRLTTMFRGDDMCLDVFNGGERNNEVHLSQCGNYTGQFWKFTPSGDGYRLTTQFRSRNMCLDIANGGDNNNEPHLAPCGNYTGQFWHLTDSGKRTD